VVVGLLAAALLLSGFFQNPSGLLDYVRSYGVWLSRAGETDLHQHPWHYYLQTLAYTHRMRGPVWSEGLILGLAFVGLAAAFTRLRRRVPAVHSSLAQFLSVYTVALTAAYSLIPYKTPWCLLNFLLGMILLAGVGAVALVRLPIADCRLPIADCPESGIRQIANRKSQIANGVKSQIGHGVRSLLSWIVGLLLLGGVGHLAWLSYQTSYVFNTDGRNPYAYAQTVPDLVDLGERMKELARVAPQHEDMVIKVLSVDEYYWPLPWYLRWFPKVGYWTEVPPDPVAPVVIASPQFDQELERRLGSTHQMTGYLGLRPTVVFGIWVQKDLWQAFLESRSKVRPGGGGEGS
jgi:predicted membrane-bound mannosyltransferase